MWLYCVAIHGVFSSVDRPPVISVPDGNQPSKQRWVPQHAVKRAAVNPETKHDVVFRKVRGILNKLTPEKFDKLSLELLNVGIDSQLVLKGIILLIFEKALEEPKYSSLYSQLSQRLCDDAPNFEPKDSNITTFRRLLLNKCQDEFENRSRLTAEQERRSDPVSADEAEQQIIAKQKMLGNLKFIGELGKMDMLHEGILHKCIKQLLEKKKRANPKDMAEDLECLCQIMRTVGPRLDSEKARAWMDQYFTRMEAYTADAELPARIRFLLQDCIDLRQNKWQPRRVMMKDAGPKTIHQVREEACRELGVFLPSQSSGAPLTGLNLFNSPGRGMMNGLSPPGGRMPDIFGPAHMHTAGMGTGPGVITMEGFGSYSQNMGRMQRNYNNSAKNKGGGFAQRGGSRSNHENGTDSDDSPGQKRRGSPQGQMNGFSKLQTASRNLPPRMQRKQGGLDGVTDGVEEVSLRPSMRGYGAQNAQPLLKPHAPQSLPKSAQTPPGKITGKGIPAAIIQQKQGNVTFKQEKKKPPKMETEFQKVTQEPEPERELSQEEFDEKLDLVLENLIDKEEVESTLQQLKQLRPSKSQMIEMVDRFIGASLSRNEQARELVRLLLGATKRDGLLHQEQFMQGFLVLLGRMPQLEPEVPILKSHLAKFVTSAVTSDVVSLQAMCKPFANGAHYPLVLLALQDLARNQGQEWTLRAVQNAKIDLLPLLPECDQSRARMMEILEDRGLSFLVPLMRVEAHLREHLRAAPTGERLQAWLDEQVEPQLQDQPEFVEMLVLTILRFVCGGTTLGPEVERGELPDKKAIADETEMLGRFSTPLRALLREKIALQLRAVYALQIHCHENQFPKGMLLRLFMRFYNLDIADEEAFLRWKEDLNDEYPGKQKALFQVNQWLTWLEQAEEESSDEEASG